MVYPQDDLVAAEYCALLVVSERLLREIVFRKEKITLA